MGSQFTTSLSYHKWWVLARTIWSKAQQSGQGTWGMVSLGESPWGGKAPPQKKKPSVEPRWLTIRHSWQSGLGHKEKWLALGASHWAPKVGAQCGWVVRFNEVGWGWKGFGLEKSELDLAKGMPFSYVGRLWTSKEVHIESKFKTFNELSLDVFYLPIIQDVK